MILSIESKLGAKSMKSIHQINQTDEASVSTVLMWALVILLGILLIAMCARLFNNLRGDNRVFYSEKGAINIRIEKLPDIRIVTKNCKDFQAVVIGNTLIISYANPFGGVKEFKCSLVGDPIKKGFVLKFTETEFKKFCHHIKPGNLSISKNRITFNYNKSVGTKLTYLKKEV